MTTGEAGKWHYATDGDSEWVVCGEKVLFTAAAADYLNAQAERIRELEAALEAIANWRIRAGAYQELEAVMKVAKEARWPELYSPDQRSVDVNQQDPTAATGRLRR